MTGIPSIYLQPWKYLQKNCSISEIHPLLTRAGSDHAIEKENEVMKVTVIVKGLSQNVFAFN